ncbi:MAG: hypothetical protein E6J75_00965 [Deltaproteobacteria bacterium]|nr:MAG: hypothetical protein E6J75_00965 [Deltaproteobacteria bacterium]
MSTRGSTLLEALVALAIAALVLAALSGATLRARAAHTDATARADRLGAGRSALLRLAAELEAARRPGTGERFALEPPADGSPPWWSLSFPTGARGPVAGSAPAGDTSVVSYRVEPDRDRPGVGTLVRRETTVPVPASEAPGIPVVAGLRALRVRCLDGGGWHSGWQAQELPRAVEVAIAQDDGRGGTEELATAVALQAATP